MGEYRLLLVAGVPDGAVGGAVAALTAAGMEPGRRAATPDEAAAAVAADPPDLVVVVLAPGPSAVAAVVDAAPQVPVLALAGQVEPDSERHAVVLAAVGAGATACRAGARRAGRRRAPHGGRGGGLEPGLADLVLQSVSSSERTRPPGSPTASPTCCASSSTA